MSSESCQLVRSIRRGKEFGSAIFIGAVPAGVPELPADLEGDDGLACSRDHRNENAPLSLQNSLDCRIDCNPLIVSCVLAFDVVEGGKQFVAGLRVFDADSGAVSPHNWPGVG